MININRTIKYVEKKSPAKQAGLKPKDIIVTINDKPIIDFIDDNYFNSLSNLKIELIRKGKEKTVIIDKDADTPLGIDYEENLYPPDRQCTNKCMFCFVDQLPNGMRDSLYVKDDDWRYSVLFGNYITLTNVDDKELTRIINRNASPLYVSVHAVDGETRSKMMMNKKARNLKEQLALLTQNKIIIHTQVVLCPNINDGEVLKETIEYLYSLYPYVRTLAIVPVGLTKFRNNLTELTPVDEAKAREIISLIESYNKKFQAEKGIYFVFASDEFYSKANLNFPIFEGGEHYPQLSNGVGMFSELNNEFNDALKTYEDEIKSINSDTKIVSITGFSAYKKISGMLSKIIDRAEKLDVNIVKIENKHFGDSITVTGLLCGTDIVNQLKNISCDVIIVPASTLKDGKNTFLDDTNIEYVQNELNAKVLVQDVDGYAMVETILQGIVKG